MSLGQFSLLYISLDLGMPAGLASLVLQAQVIFTIVIAAVVLGERADAPAGRSVRVIGTAGLVAGRGRATAPRRRSCRSLVMLGAALSWAIGNVIARAAGVASGFSLVVWSALVVPVPALRALPAGRRARRDRRARCAPVGRAIASTVYTAVGASLVGYGIWNSLLARYPAGAVVPFILLVPLVGIAAAWVAQDEVPTALESVGGVVMMVGVAVATVQPPAATTPAAPRGPSTPAARHRLRADARGVRRRVDQAERRLDGGAGLGRVEVGAQLPQRVDPDVDVGQLQLAHRRGAVGAEVGPLAVLDDDQRGVAQGELDVPGDQRVEGGLGVGGARRALASLRQEPLADRDERLGQDVVLAGEVLVERRAGDAARAADVVHRDAVEPALGEQGRGGVEDLLAAGHGHRSSLADRSG